MVDDTSYLNIRREEELGRRFAEPFGSRLWHEDGAPFTEEEYIEAGFDPPTQQQLEAWAQQEAQIAEDNTSS